MARGSYSALQHPCHNAAVPTAQDGTKLLPSSAGMVLKALHLKGDLFINHFFTCCQNGK